VLWYEISHYFVMDSIVHVKRYFVHLWYFHCGFLKTNEMPSKCSSTILIYVSKYSDILQIKILNYVISTFERLFIQCFKNKIKLIIGVHANQPINFLNMYISKYILISYSWTTFNRKMSIFFINGILKHKWRTAKYEIEYLASDTKKYLYQNKLYIYSILPYVSSFLKMSLFHQLFL
jgi:hypothetical protein